MHHLYILLCADNSYYTSVTKNLARRMKQHHEGKAVYTTTRLPVKLVYQEKFVSEEAAVAREKQIKGWTRAKKEALIQGAGERLPQLAKKRFG